MCECVCGGDGGGGVTRLVFNAEKRKGNPRCFPPARFCLVKLNANTQKADGLISAQISGVLFGMLSLHLSGQRAGFTPLPPARSCDCCGGSVVDERGHPTWRSKDNGQEFKLKCCFVHTNPNERVSRLVKRPSPAWIEFGSIRSDCGDHEADSAF